MPRSSAPKKPVEEGRQVVKKGRVSKRATKRKRASSGEGSQHSLKECGHAIGTAYRHGKMEYVQAVLDIKEENQDILRFDEDDLCDDFLRDFKYIGVPQCIQIKLPDSSATLDEKTFESDLFMGYLIDGALVSLILAPMTQNKKGCWIGENITYITQQSVAQLNEELPSKILEQIRQYRQIKLEQEEIWKQQVKLCKWEENLEYREKVLNQMEAIDAEN